MFTGKWVDHPDPNFRHASNNDMEAVSGLGTIFNRSPCMCSLPRSPPACAGQMVLIWIFLPDVGARCLLHASQGPV